MIACREIIDKLSEYVDNELNEEDVKLVDQHVSQCEACKKELKYYRSMDEEMKDIMNTKPPVDGLEKLFKRIDDRNYRNTRQ